MTWDASDETLLLVVVNVKDLNDNAPKFSRRRFTAGVTRDTQVAEEPVLLLKVISCCWLPQPAFELRIADFAAGLQIYMRCFQHCAFFCNRKELICTEEVKLNVHVTVPFTFLRCFQDYVVDPDSPQNQEAQFFIVPPFFITEPLRSQVPQQKQCSQQLQV